MSSLLPAAFSAKMAPIKNDSDDSDDRVHNSFGGRLYSSKQVDQRARQNKESSESDILLQCIVLHKNHIKCIAKP